MHKIRDVPILMSKKREDNNVASSDLDEGSKNKNVTSKEKPLHSIGVVSSLRTMTNHLA